MIVTNPTSTDISVQINGKQYTVLAHDKISGVLPDHAAYWKVKLHTFIELEEEGTDVYTPTPDALTNDLPDVVDVVEEELVEEKTEEEAEPAEVVATPELPEVKPVVAPKVTTKKK